MKQDGNGAVSLEPVHTVRSYEAVSEQIHDRIREGEWQVGDKIPSERALAARFGVSRVVIREAMRHLGAMGLIEVRHGSGTYVRRATDRPVSQSVTLLLELQKASYVDLMTVRRSLELTSARLAASRVTPDDRKALTKIMAKMDKTARKGLATLPAYGEYGKHDLELHMLVAKVARNEPLATLISAILPMLLAPRMDIARQYVGLEQYLARRGIELMHEEHQDIVDSISEGNPGRAEKVMGRHLARSVDFWTNL
jgi:GntR family transcriptional regulator, transcriptional repressor for pyruvate dehydrogenase complex